VNLRYLVPALGILVSSSGALFAENVGGLTVGGYVDTVGTVADVQDDGDSAAKTFSSAVELRIGYKVGDKVTAQVDIEFNNFDSWDTDLEQAYVNYAITDTFSLTTGKFTSYAGWTAADADGLYRINASPIVNLYTADLIGVAANFAPSEDLGISVFLVNGLFDGAYNDPANDHVAVAADLVYKVKDVGSFNVEAGYDQINADQSAYSIAANTTLKFASYEPLTLGAEIMLDNFSDDAADTDGDALGFLLMANHTIPSAPCPMSGTLMLTIVQADAESGVDLGQGTADDSSSMELAVALLTNPTGDSHFGVNAELAYQTVSSDAAGVDDLKGILFALEAIAVIP